MDGYCSKPRLLGGDEYLKHWTRDARRCQTTVIITMGFRNNYRDRAPVPCDRRGDGEGSGRAIDVAAIGMLTNADALFWSSIRLQNA
jgi:hypothetical protein